MTPVMLATRLNIGGRWYNSGSIVDLEDKDAKDYLAMRMATMLPASGVLAQPRRERNVQVGDVITKDGVTGPRDPVPDPDPDNGDETDELDSKKEQSQPGKPKLNPNPQRTAKRS
jgi:hypothetical protein